MQVSITELKTNLQIIALKYVSSEEAKYFAEEISEAYIRKHPRCNVLKDEVISDTERQEKYKGNEIEVKKELPSLLHLDFHNLPMTFKIKWIHDKLIEKAQKTGISILGLDNSGGMHTLHTWTQGLAKRGYFAIAGYNGGPSGVIPFNGTQGLLGTNPISYAFPANEGEIVIDMATSQIPYFEIRNCKKENKELRENSAVDCEGNVTRDVNKALAEDGTSNILPMGANYKGYNINYLIEVMTGALVGAKLSNKMNPTYVNEEHGGFLIVIDINAFNSTDSFKKEVSEFNIVIRNQKPKKGETVLVPGDNNLERLRKATELGTVDVDDEIWQKVIELTK
ncbi:Ldh family oxidoreductase [Candidatus Dojkabacteria bacterium]|nr:Ldh family oxidoreductase [Candidatus Dojkabacteria bacterium]